MNQTHEVPEPDYSPTVPMPRIYVACLASYNAGELVGEWIDASDADDMASEIAEMLERSPIAGAEEYAIHDYEGFGAVSLGEYESLETVAELAAGINEHGEAFAAYASNQGLEYLEPEGFEDAYCGKWDSGRDYAEDFYYSTGSLSDDFPLASYIDWDSVWRGEFDCAGHWTSDASGGGVHIFSA